MTRNILVIGGGFRSIIAAYGYAKKGYDVTIVDSGPKIGGFMSPIKWKNFWLDKGPQYFDNFSIDDISLIEEIVGPKILEDIGFKYASYNGGSTTLDFAIPDWTVFGNDYCQKIFNEVVQQIILNKNTNTESKGLSLQSYFQHTFGNTMSDSLELICQKILSISSTKVSKQALEMITFGGRALLFDDVTSKTLKNCPVLDNVIAAQKKVTDKKHKNFYPKFSNLEKVRTSLENGLIKHGVKFLLERNVNDIDVRTKTVLIDDVSIYFDEIFLGIDCRIAEQILFGTNNLEQNTHCVPEIFHFFELKGEYKSDTYYTMNYDTNHLLSRITNFHNYLGDGEHLCPVICAEEPVNIDTFDRNDASKNIEKVKKEVCEIEKFDKDYIADTGSYFIPVTYKIPKIGYDTAQLEFRHKVNRAFGDYCVLPSMYTLTRKQTIDDLRTLALL